MNTLLKLALCLSLVHFALAGLSLTKTISIDNSWGADFVGSLNDDTMVVIYEDTDHAMHIALLDIDSGVLNNDTTLDFDDTCSLDGTNSQYALQGNFLYMTCMGVWNGVYMIEYDLQEFNISREFKPDSNIITEDLELITFSADGKYIYATQEDTLYFVQIQVSSFTITNVVKIPTNYGQLPYINGFQATTQYIYVNIFTGQLIIYDANTLKLQGQVLNNLKGLNQGFIVVNNLVYIYYDDYFAVYTPTFQLVKNVTFVESKAFFPNGALATSEYAYWLYANGVISLQLSSTEPSNLPVVNKHSVIPMSLAAAQSNSSLLIMAACLQDNDFGQGVIYYLQQE